MLLTVDTLVPTHVEVVVDVIMVVEADVLEDVEVVALVKYVVHLWGVWAVLVSSAVNLSIVQIYVVPIVLEVVGLVVCLLVEIVLGHVPVVVLVPPIQERTILYFIS